LIYGMGTMKTKPANSKDESPGQYGDWTARQFFSAADLQMSPEEYAARNAHLWACFGLDRHDYEDRSLATWVRRLGEVLADPAELERCRQRFLKPEEFAEIRGKEAEDF
jgi:hypothetical protein